MMKPLQLIMLRHCVAYLGLYPTIEGTNEIKCNYRKSIHRPDVCLAVLSRLIQEINNNEYKFETSTFDCQVLKKHLLRRFHFTGSAGG